MVKKTVKKFICNLSPKRKYAVLFCSDSHKWLNIQKKSFGPSIDGLDKILKFRNFTTLQIAGSPSFLNQKNSFGNFKKINFVYIFSFIVKKILGERYRTEIEKNIFFLILKILRPKVVFGLGLRPGLCEACYLMNIPCVEIMHGYGYDPDIYFWDNCNEKQIPSHFWVFDETSKRSLQKLMKKKECQPKIEKIPHIWKTCCAKWADEFKSISIREKAGIPSKYKYVVLFSLQWAYANEDNNYKEFHNIIENGLVPQPLIEAVTLSQNNIFWLFRRHPVQIKNKKYDYQKQILNKLINNFKNIEWQHSSNHHPFSFLKEVDAHITMSSMTCYEAASFDVRSLILCPNFQKYGKYSFYFSDLEKIGMAEKKEANCSEILKFVFSGKKRSSFKFDNSFKRMTQALSQFQ